MNALFKKLFSLFLVLALIGSMFPAVAAQEQVTEFTDADYASVDALFDELDQMENEPARKNATETQLTDAAEALVKASDDYVSGSLDRNGNSFTWWTADGIRCVYSPRMRQIEKDMVAPAEPLADGIYNEPAATKGGWPASNQVFLIGPYYGHDSNFSNQYKYEAQSIATAIGDTDGYTLYSGTAATVDKIASAMSNGAVVIFDSHGTTDYESGYDYVTGATSSYLCLTSTSGLTSADYDDGALYYSDGICINGATISNHMTTNSPSGILWMAICLGMATDSFCTPLRARGVEVVYGYSQSVTFDGDYLWEATFWDNMTEGKTVAQSVAAMKSEWGEWDYNKKIANYYGYTSTSDYYANITEARADYSAFPIVVSDEDAHPGQRKGSFYGADSLQTVKSTYTLYSQYSVTASSNNTAYGTVSVSGSTITAAPKTGYFAQSATVLSGNATVTQNGYSGDAMTLPTVTAPEGYTFLGWMSSPLSGETTEKPAYFDSFTPTASTTLYALYSYVDENTGSGTGDYVKVTSAPADWSGEYVIVYEPDGYVFNSSLTTLDSVSNYQPVTITDNTIAAEDGDAYKVTIEAMDGGYAIKTASGSYIGGNSGSNALVSGSSGILNTISLDSEGNANIISSTSYLRYNATSGQYRFRYYKSSSYSNQQPIALYLKDGSAGTTYYTGSATKCEHANTANTSAVAATCTQAGYTAGVYCNDCESYVSGHQVIDPLGHSWSSWTQASAPTCTEAGSETRSCSTCGASETQSIPATGHSYNAVVTPPTATEQGFTTYTCSVCSDSYISDYTEALGQSYTVSFKVPAEVTAPQAMTCGKAGITLPTAAAPSGYTFAGWATEAIEDTETAPTLYKAGSTYTTTANTALYAVYTYVVGGTGESGYVLKDISQITADDVFVITVEYSDGTIYALPNNSGTSTPSAIIISAANGKLTNEPASTLLWNLGGTASGYTFYPNGSTSSWLYCTSTNKGVKVGTNSDKTFVIDSASGYLKHLGTNRYVGVYRTNPDWRCYTSPTTNIGDQELGFYVKSAGGTTHYTSLMVAEPVAEVNGTTYTSFEEAVSACTAGNYVKLLADVEAEMILEADLYIDLAGFSLTGLLDPDGFAVYGMDSTTDGYTGSNAGTFSCTDIDDVPVVPVTVHKFDGKRCMAVKDTEGYSFHRFFLGITHATVKPTVNGVGYKATFCGDDAVKAQLVAFGYTLQLGVANDPVTVMNSADSFVSGKVVTLRVDNYDCTNYGEETLNAKVALILADGTMIESTTCSMSLRDMMESINANTSAFTADQLAAIKTMIANNPVMAGWDLDNI